MSVTSICCKAILVTKDFNLACLHNIYITIEVTINDIKAVTKKKNIYYITIKKRILLEFNQYYQYAHFTNQKFLFVSYI